MKTQMKTKLVIAVAAFAVTLSSTAFAETAKPNKNIKPNVDTTTTQSIEPVAGIMKCGDGLITFKMAKACGNANNYPVNALSGMNLN